jgi:uncharacterized protein (TIGR03435 family)
MTGKLFASAILAGASLVQAHSQFEAASVKIAATQEGTSGPQGGPGSCDPERYSARSVTLRLLLCIACATADCQQRISGSGWLDTKKYDLEAKISPGTTKPQRLKHLQYLLTGRSVCDLVFAKADPN